MPNRYSKLTFNSQVLIFQFDFFLNHFCSTRRNVFYKKRRWKNDSRNTCHCFNKKCLKNVLISTLFVLTIVASKTVNSVITNSINSYSSYCFSRDGICCKAAIKDQKSVHEFFRFIRKFVITVIVITYNRVW